MIPSGEALPGYYTMLSTIGAIIAIAVGALTFYKFYLDRPKLLINPRSTQNPQISLFFRYPESRIGECRLYRYGFIASFTVLNKGNKDTTLLKWDLSVLLGELFIRMPPYKIPRSPSNSLGDSKTNDFTSLEIGEHNGYDAIVKARGAIKIKAFYILHLMSKGDISLINEYGNVIGSIDVTDANEKIIGLMMEFSEIPFEKGRRMVGDIDFATPDRTVTIDVES